MSPGKDRRRRKRKTTQKHAGDGEPLNTDRQSARRTEELGTDKAQATTGLGAFCCVNRKPLEDSRRVRSPGRARWMLGGTRARWGGYKSAGGGCHNLEASKVQPRSQPEGAGRGASRNRTVPVLSPASGSGERAEWGTRWVS